MRNNDLKEFIVIYFLVILLEPGLTLLHEIGHGIPLLLFTKGDVKIEIGNSYLSKKVQLGRFLIEFRGYNSIMDISYGRVYGEFVNNRIKAIIIALSGPMVSLMLFLISLIILSSNTISEYYILELILKGIKWNTIGKTIITLIPIKYNFHPYISMKSDGYRAVELLKPR